MTGRSSIHPHVSSKFLLPDTLAVLLPLLARVSLASVFGLAGVAKLAGRRAAGQSLTAFGVPERIAELSASFLAAVEILCAVALLPTATAWLGATGVALLLTVFIVVIAVTLARGRRPQCHCFGQLRSEPIGPRILVRNGALLLAAAFVVWDAAPRSAGAHAAASWADAGQILASASAASLLVAASLVTLAGMAAVLVTVLRQYGKLLVRVDRLESEVGIASQAVSAGLPVGAVAPGFDLASLDGEPVSLAALQARAKSVVLVFVEPDCGACSDLLPDVAAAQQRLEARDAVSQSRAARTVRDRHERGVARPAPSTIVVLVSRGDARENRSKIAGLTISDVLLQKGREVAEAYRVVGTPSAVRVTKGMIASPLAAGPEAVRSLLDASAESADDMKIGPGDELPSFTLKDLEGRPTELLDIARTRALLLFWSPTCGYCQEMLADLKAWDRRADSSDTTLVVISQGSISLNRRQELRSPVLLDDDFVVGRALGASGTPSAVLIEDGRVASDVRAGAQAVFELASHKQALAALAR